MERAFRLAKSHLKFFCFPPHSHWPSATMPRASSRLLEDERVELVPEPAGIDALLPALFKYPSPTGKLVTDAYLAAFAMSASMQLVTFNRGFRQFKGLDVTILNRNNV